MGRSAADDHEFTPLAPLWHPTRQDEHSEIVVDPESGGATSTQQPSRPFRTTSC